MVQITVVLDHDTSYTISAANRIQASGVPGPEHTSFTAHLTATGVFTSCGILRAVAIHRRALYRNTSGRAEPGEIQHCACSDYNATAYAQIEHQAWELQAPLVLRYGRFVIQLGCPPRLIYSGGEQCDYGPLVEVLDILHEDLEHRGKLQQRPCHSRNHPPHLQKHHSTVRQSTRSPPIFPVFRMHDSA